MKNAKKLLALLLAMLFIVLAIGSGSSSSSDTDTADKPDDNVEVNEAVVEEEPAAPQIVPVVDGNNIIIDDKEVLIKKCEFSYDVVPDNPDSFYSHYAAETGKVYIVLTVDVKNVGKNNLDCDEILDVTADYNNGYTYSGFAIVDEGGDFGYANITAITPLSTQRMRYLIECPSEVETSSAPLFLTITINGAAHKYTIR